MAKEYIFKANNSRTFLVAYSFWLFITLSAIAPLIGAYTLIKFSIAMREKTNETKDAFLYIAQQYDTVSGWIGICFIVCAIIFSFWIYRASSNTHSLNPNIKIEFRPGLCLGSYFIPFLNLYWPYKSMKELWLLNVKSNNTDIILSWWITYLLFNFTAIAVLKLSINDQLGLQWYIGLDTASNVFGIISALLAIKIVKKINKIQHPHDGINVRNNWLNVLYITPLIIIIILLTKIAFDKNQLTQKINPRNNEKLSQINDDQAKNLIIKGLNKSVNAKLAVYNYGMQNNRLPLNQVETGYVSPDASEEVASITIANDGSGKIIIVYGDLFNYKTIVMTPTLSNENGKRVIFWNCQGGTLTNKYRPTICQIH